MFLFKSWLIVFLFFVSFSAFASECSPDMCPPYSGQDVKFSLLGIREIDQLHTYQCYFEYENYGETQQFHYVSVGCFAPDCGDGNFNTDTAECEAAQDDGGTETRSSIISSASVVSLIEGTLLVFIIAFGFRFIFNFILESHK